MADVYRATRQFEKFFGHGILDRGYIPPQPASPAEDSQLVAIIRYDNRNKRVRVEKE